ncbi:caspase-4-like [Otolemur garnettii]|uniref:caspase-4-like n=1 Tax=Otolemur garnettii TaxID=30611 RepID=UPI000C7F3308|nr:caspase-4-like [Otolemur garnettii]
MRFSNGHSLCPYLLLLENLSFLTENNQENKNPLKMLEALGKDVINEFLNTLSDKNVVKIKEEEKENFRTARTKDKARIFGASLKEKQEEAVRLLMETCLFLEEKPTSKEAPPNTKTGPPEAAEPTDTLKLCPHEDFLRLSKERAGEVLCSMHETGKKRKTIAFAKCKIWRHSGVWKFHVFTENRGEVWVRDSPEALVDSTSQSPDTLEDDAVHKTHVEKDFIAFCSSTPHNVSWRDRTKGSLFITQLVTCFQKYSWHYHLEEIFRKVQQSFETPSVRAQMPTVERLSMTRYFYLFPGN